MLKKLTTLLLLLLILGCKEHNKQSHTVEIINVLFNDATAKKMNFLAFPPPPYNPKYHSDILIEEMKKGEKIPKDTIKIINEYIKKHKKLIVAVNTPLMKTDYSVYSSRKSLKKIFDEETDFFKSKIKNIDVTKIKNNKYAVAMTNDYYNYPKKQQEAFIKYDIILNFSEILFNKEKTRAIIIMGEVFGRKNGFSAIYLLEKVKERRWKIKHKEGLTIS